MGTTVSGHPPGRYVSPAAGYAGNPSERAAAQSQGTKLHRQYVSPAAGSFASVQYLEERNEYIMKKYFLKKLLAVCTALSLLSSSAFAASFGDLQDAIDGNTGAGEFIGMHGDDHYGYGKNEDGSYGVESWTTTTENEDGTTTSSNNVQLNEDVSKEDGSKDRLVVGEEDGSVTIDLNGNDITSDNYDPEVGTANNGTPGAGGEYGSVITVGQGADLTLKDTSSDNAAEQGVISGGFGVYDGGGGILVDGGALNMEGGNISGNAS